LPIDDELTPQARKLLAGLIGHQTGVRRPELTWALQKKRLTTYDEGLLQKMAHTGLIEVQRYTTKTRVRAFEYRAKSSAVGDRD
jgi:hypothetical protein